MASPSVVRHQWACSVVLMAFFVVCCSAWMAAVHSAVHPLALALRHESSCCDVRVAYLPMGLLPVKGLSEVVVAELESQTMDLLRVLRSVLNELFQAMEPLTAPARQDEQVGSCHQPALQTLQESADESTYLRRLSEVLLKSRPLESERQDESSCCGVQTASSLASHQQTRTPDELASVHATRHSHQKGGDQQVVRPPVLVHRHELSGSCWQTENQQVAFLAVVRHQWVCSVALMEGCVVCCLS